MKRPQLSRLGVAAVIGAALALVGVLVTTVALSWHVDDVAATPTTRPTTPRTTTTSASPTTTTTTSAAPTTTATAKAPPAAAANCANPEFSTSEGDDGWSDGDYYVHNNMWNAADYSVSQKLAACSAGNWSVTTTANDDNGDGAVKTYPNVHKDYHDWDSGKEPPLRQYSRLTSTFAATSPHTGIYNVGYDIWLNGVPGNREIMIWTENYRQSPAGDRVAGGLPFSGATWDLYATDDNEYLAFIPSRALTKGSLDLKAFLDYLVDNGRVPTDSTLGQICFGVEIVSTGGKPATFQFTDFSITD
jgi:glycosyl hydrolase family 12